MTQVDLISADTLLIGIKRSEVKKGRNAAGEEIVTGAIVGNFANRADFDSFLTANKEILYNVSTEGEIDLVDLRFCGVFTEPLSLLVAGPENLVLRIEKAWFMRLLQPPIGFVLQRVGKITALSASLVRQRPAAKLSDACIVSMNILHRMSSKETAHDVEKIRQQLSSSFPNILVPDYHVVNQMLQQMFNQNMVYYRDGMYSSHPIPEPQPILAEPTEPIEQSVRVTPYPSKENDDPNTEDILPKPLAIQARPSVGFSQTVTQHVCSSDNDSGLGDQNKAGKSAQTSSGGEQPISASRIFNFFRGRSFRRKNKKKLGSKKVKGTKKSNNVDSAITSSQAITTSPGSTQEIIHPLPKDSEDAAGSRPDKPLTEGMGDSVIKRASQSIMTTTTTTTHQQIEVQTLTEEQAFDRGFLNRRQRQHERLRSQLPSSFQTGSQRKNKHRRSGYKSSDTESVISMTSSNGRRRGRVSKSTRIALRNFKTYHIDNDIPTVREAIPEEKSNQTPSPTSPVPAARKTTAANPVATSTPKLPAPKPRTRSTPSYAAKPPIILTPKRGPSNRKQDFDFLKLPSSRPTRQSTSGIPADVKSETVPTLTKSKSQNIESREMTPSSIGTSVAGTGYSHLSGNSLSLPKKQSLGNVPTSIRNNGIPHSKTDTNIAGMESISAAMRHKLHSSTNSIASSTKPVINLDQYPQISELANSLKDLRLSRQQWIDLFKEHNLLELLAKNQSGTSVGRSKSNATLNVSPSIRTIGRIRGEKAQAERASFRRHLSSAGEMAKTLNTSIDDATTATRPGTVSLNASASKADYPARYRGDNNTNGRANAHDNRRSVSLSGYQQARTEFVQEQQLQRGRDSIDYGGGGDTPPLPVI